MVPEPEVVDIGEDEFGREFGGRAGIVGEVGGGDEIAAPGVLLFEDAFELLYGGATDFVRGLEAFALNEDETIGVTSEAVDSGIIGFFGDPGEEAVSLKEAHDVAFEVERVERLECGFEGEAFGWEIDALGLCGVVGHHGTEVVAGLA